MRIAVTRPRSGAQRTCGILRDHGFIPVLQPLLRYETDEASLASVFPQVATSDWLLFTSAQAVQALDGARRAAGGVWPDVRVACVGPATAAAAAAVGLTADVVPDRYDSASLAHMLSARGIRGCTCLWPRAEQADEALGNALRAAGATVVDVVAYRTLPYPAGARRLARDLRAARVGGVLLLSPTAVDAYVGLGVADAGTPIVAVLGRSTGARAEQYGLPVHVRPDSNTIHALAKALREYCDDAQTIEG